MAKTETPKKVVPKFGVHENIQFVGLHDLTPDEQDFVQSTAEECQPKIKRVLQNLTDLIVHAQVSGVQVGKEKRKRYTFHVRAISPGQHFESAKCDDYDMPKALHRCFDEIIAQIQHKLRTDSTRPKPYA